MTTGLGMGNTDGASTRDSVYGIIRDMFREQPQLAC